MTHKMSLDALMKDQASFPCANATRGLPLHYRKTLEDIVTARQVMLNEWIENLCAAIRSSRSNVDNSLLFERAQCTPIRLPVERLTTLLVLTPLLDQTLPVQEIVALACHENEAAIGFIQGKDSPAILAQVVTETIGQLTLKTAIELLRPYCLTTSEETTLRVISDVAGHGFLNGLKHHIVDMNELGQQMQTLQFPVQIQASIYDAE